MNHITFMNAVLQLMLRSSNGEVTTGEVYKRFAGVAKSTVQRYLRDLVSMRVLERRTRGRYTIGKSDTYYNFAMIREKQLKMAQHEFNRLLVTDISSDWLGDNDD